MAGKIKDRAGHRHGRLTVLALERVERTPDHVGTYWRCRCDCGSELDVNANSLTSGNTRSCGCYVREVNRLRLTKHGGKGTGAYRSWKAAKNRCFNPNNKRYPVYGGRGVTMCERWAADFAAFLADMGERPDGMTLDRYPDPDGSYEPGNCRWATSSQQGETMRKTMLVELDGRQVSVLRCIKAKGLKPSQVYRLIRGGLSPQAAIDTAGKAAA